MNFWIKPNLRCSICGQGAFRHSGWFLAVENRWLDRLRIYDWHPSLAAGNEVGSACCREHLKTLIDHWLSESNLSLPRRDQGPPAIAGIPDRDDFESGARVGGRMVAELAVCREPFSRGWTGTPEILDGIVNAIPGREEEIQSYAMKSQPTELLHETAHEMALR
jgi:hypothetical protein